MSDLGGRENGVGQNNGTNIRTNDRKHAKVYPREARNGILDNKIDYLENKMRSCLKFECRVKKLGYRNWANGPTFFK